MKEKTNLIMAIVIFLFGMFVSYQVLRIIFGGSWSAEGAILALLIFNVTLSVHNTRVSIGNKHDIGYLKENMREVRGDIKELSEDFRELSRDFRKFATK